MFEISSRTEYGARALVDLAERWGQPPVGLNQIAVRQDISFKYLEQLMLPLRKHGLVRAVRGKNGGYQLARPPEKISIADIVAALEGPVRMRDCAPDGHSCGFTDRCLLRFLWREMESVLGDVMARHTLADLVPRRKRGTRVRIRAPRKALGSNGHVTAPSAQRISFE